MEERMIRGATEHEFAPMETFLIDFCEKHSKRRLYDINLKDDCPICVIEDYGEVKIFFRTKKIRVNEESIKDVLNGLVYNDNCSGYNIDRLLNGDIWVYFNPTVHKDCDRRRAIEKVVEELNRHKLCLDELDA